MNYSYPQIVMNEIPGEITLALSISGCPLRCKGCHSTETYDPNFGKELTFEEIDRLLNIHKHISAILFYGGEWNGIKLSESIDYIKTKKNNLKIGLYSGFELSFFNKDLLKKIDFLKVGAFKEKLGGLDNPNTNQRFFILKNGELFKDLTDSFIKKN